MDRNRNEVLKQISDVFCELLDRDDIILKEEYSPDDVEGWDSLINIHLAVALERLYKIRFTSGQMQNWKSIGGIIDSVLDRLQE